MAAAPRRWTAVRKRSRNWQRSTTDAPFGVGASARATSRTDRRERPINHDGDSDWPTFFDYFVAQDVRARTIQSVDPAGDGQKIWPGLAVDEGDSHIIKNRYSALVPGSSHLERVLRAGGYENLLISGTKTNVCCEATARDAMMMDFRVVMVSDCLAALSDDEHRASLETMIQQFGDVMTADEALAVLRSRRNSARP